MDSFVDTIFADGGAPVIVLGIVTILLGAVESFLGYRIFKIQVAIVAFLAGLAIGISAFNAAFGIQWLAIALGVVLGALLGWLSMKIYKVGVFIVVGSLAFTVAFLFVHNGWFGLIAAVIVGVLGVLLTKHVIIITTAISGGSMIAGGVAILIWGASQAAPLWLQVVSVVVFGVSGIIVQYRTNRDAK
ncbi:TMEM198/TM7SF3 family protein [Ruminococcaceae bacterium OttesenSCG-928-D13]|nr:TMEM198/TM7SF3 family protein [Ruminococcaceae bacterium OttesenSCG-928-D13]